MLRFVLGSSIGVFLQLPAQPDAASTPIVPTAPTKADVKPVLKGLVDGRLALAYPPFDPAKSAAPAETRAYWQRVYPDRPNDPVPVEAVGWLKSSIPYAAATDAVPPEGADPYTLPIPPGLEAGDYLVQTLLGYDDAAA